MSGRVAVLPDHVANQIAAGEVVDRPASVVKELVENALDAGARLVRVEISEGGKTSISVSDDGSGMDRDDAVLALDRHATSKIVSAADLVGVATFGFRGEALPAIGSVSRLTVITAANGTEGTEILMTGGRIDRVAPVARQRGTTVSARSLFFNTPARRKFLRSASSETRAIWDSLGVLALTNPEVGFELVADGNTRLAVPAGQDEVTRLAAVWGADLVQTLIPVQHAVGSVQVSGLIQRPGDARPTGRRCQLFVNGRPFRDGFLIRAAEAGYRSAIAPGDRPTMLLRITVPPGEVDVNVHPAKLEVRFRERFQVERALEEAVRDALGSLLAAAPLGARQDSPISTGQSGEAPPRLREGAPGRPGVPPTDLWRSAEGDSQPELLGTTGTSAPLRRPPSPLIQLQQTYLVFDSAEGITFVDQHSAHERVLYERVMTDFSSGVVASQRLLLPITVELTDEELEVAEHFGEELNRVGFEVTSFGGRSLALHAVPMPHPRFDAARCFREMVADLARGRFGGWANRLERFAATYACRAAVKAGTPLSEPEMRALLLALFETALPPHDVHGRSTIVTLAPDELERRFGRR